MVEHDIGGRLRRAREQRGLSIADAAKLTKLSHTVLRAIERNDFASLPDGLYRKAYLRTLAAEVGVDPSEVTAEYDALQPAPDEGPHASDVPRNGADPLIEALTSSRRRAVIAAIVLAALGVIWIAVGPDTSTPRSRGEASGDKGPPAFSSQEHRGAVENARQRNPGNRVADKAAIDVPLKVELTASGLCWVAAESDGEQLLYRLVNPGEHLVFEGRRKIRLRLGDAGSVTVAVNGGPRQTPGAKGEVVELELTSAGLHSPRPA